MNPYPPPFINIFNGFDIVENAFERNEQCLASGARASGVLKLLYLTFLGRERYLLFSQKNVGPLTLRTFHCLSCCNL